MCVCYFVLLLLILEKFFLKNKSFIKRPNSDYLISSTYLQVVESKPNPIQKVYRRETPNLMKRLREKALQTIELKIELNCEQIDFVCFTSRKKRGTTPSLK